MQQQAVLTTPASANAQAVVLLRWPYSDRQELLSDSLHLTSFREAPGDDVLVPELHSQARLCSLAFGSEYPPSKTRTGSVGSCAGRQQKREL